MKIREAMQAHQVRTGEKITYELLADRTGLARATLESIGTRPSYNASLRTIDKICNALGCTPANLLAFMPSEEREHNENIT